jgi:hypothetical protein
VAVDHPTVAELKHHMLPDPINGRDLRPDQRVVSQRREVCIVPWLSDDLDVLDRSVDGVPTGDGSYRLDLG